MKFQLPAVDQPIIRILVDTGRSDSAYITHDYPSGQAGDEVEIEVNPGDRVGYVGVDNGGKEVGETLLMHAEPKPPVKPEPKADKTILGKPVDVAPAAPAATLGVDCGKTVVSTNPALMASVIGEDAKPAADLPPETVKVDEKPEVKVTRKK